MGRRRKTIEITTNEEKLKIFQLLNSFKSKTEAYKAFGLSDNAYGKAELERISNIVSFDLNVYVRRRNRPTTYCLQCGKELTYGQHKFCSKSCSATYNNLKRDHKIYENVSKKLTKEKINRKQKGINKKQTTYRHVCENCGMEYESKQPLSSYCSIKCANEQKHKKNYQDFLRNNDKYCRGNYTPKAFKKDFLEEQNGVCAICGCQPTHNNKLLVFILDHIDGNAANNKRENLRCICPNCDSQLETFKSKNKNSTRRNYWKEKYRQ